MKKTTFILFFFLLGAISTFAQTTNTGDTEFDGILKDLNLSASANLSLFKKDLSVSFNVEEGKLEKIMLNYNMQPADLFMTLQIAKQSGKTADQVAESFKVNKGKGWGVIAKEMGIKPGSPEFHALKNNAKGKKDKMKGSGKNKGNGKGKK